MIENKSAFIKTLIENNREKYEAGWIKFNIPDHENRYKTINGEEVWGWCDVTDREKYNDDAYTGTITAILLNESLEYFGFLHWGDVLQLKCHGNNRPTLDPEWIDEKIEEAKKEAQ